MQYSSVLLASLLFVSETVHLQSLATMEYPNILKPKVHSRMQDDKRWTTSLHQTSRHS